MKETYLVASVEFDDRYTTVNYFDNEDDAIAYYHKLLDAYNSSCLAPRISLAKVLRSN